jgi:hypothetical protein
MAILSAGIFRKAVLVMRSDRFAQLRQSERRGVGREPVAQRAHARFDHRGGRGEVGLADLHVDHLAPGGFERVRAREHVHDFERLDFRDAARRELRHRGRHGGEGL